MKTLCQLTLCLMFFTQLTGCAGLGKTYESSQIESIKSVAVLGVEVIQPSEFDIFKPKQIDGGAMNFSVSSPSQHVQIYYDDLREGLKTKLRMSSPTSSTLVANSSYKNIYKDTMTGFQSTQPNAQGTSKFVLPEMVDFDAARKIGVAGRDQIMEALKVNALVVAQIHVQLNGTSVMGIGNKYPQSNIRLQMYKKGVESPVWQDGAQGEEMKESVGKSTLTMDVTKMNKLAAASAKSAFEQLIKQSQEK